MIDQYVGHAAVGDVDGEGAQLGYLDRDLQVVDEGGLVGQPYVDHLAVPAFAAHPDQSCRSLEGELGDRLGHGQHSGLQQYGRHAHGVGAGHRRILGGFEDDESHVRFGVTRRQDDVGVVHRRTARLEQQELAQVVRLGLQVDPLVEHGLAGHVADAPDDDLAHLALGVTVDDVQDSFPAHTGLPCPTSRAGGIRRGGRRRRCGASPCARCR